MRALRPCDWGEAFPSRRVPVEATGPECERHGEKKVVRKAPHRGVYCRECMNERRRIARGRGR